MLICNLIYNMYNQKLSIYLIGFFSFASLFLLGYANYIEVPNIDIEVKDKLDKSYTPDYENETGEEISFVYIGSSGCVNANRKGFPEIIKTLKRRVHKKVKNNGRSFSAIGVAVDWKPVDGIEHLRKFGTFDEVMAGRSWMNTGALKYMWEDIPGKPATPQIVIIKRKNRIKRGVTYQVKKEELLSRKVGIQEIRRWRDRGIPLPSL